MARHVRPAPGHAVGYCHRLTLHWMRPQVRVHDVQASSHTHSSGPWSNGPWQQPLNQPRNLTLRWHVVATTAA